MPPAASIFVPRQPSAGWQSNPLPERSLLDWAFASTAFALLLAANVILFSFKLGGIPTRSILAAGMLLFFAAFYCDETLAALRRNALLLGLAAGLAVQGAFVSLVNGAPAGDIAQGLIEVHLQTAVVLIVTATLAQVCGARTCVWIIVAVVGLSVAVAMLQLMHVSFAWSLRQHLGPFAYDEFNPKAIEGRPTGLSFSPIQLSTQLCVAFAAFAAVRDRKQEATADRGKGDPLVILALLGLVAASIATATRSPILGAFVFLAIYVAFRRGSWLPFWLLIGGVLVYFAWPLLMSAVQTNAPRVTRIDDSSTAARSVFAYYGTRLFLDNPLGYGLTFQPSNMWQGYWSDLYMMRAANGARIHDLHNYALSMLNIYGVGILLFVPFIAKLFRQAGASLLFFIPYAIHIMFHNSGPFYNDIVLWFGVAAIAAVEPSAGLDPRLAWAGGDRFGAMRGARPLHPRAIVQSNLVPR